MCGKYTLLLYRVCFEVNPRFSRPSAVRFIFNRTTRRSIAFTANLLVSVPRLLTNWIIEEKMSQVAPFAKSSLHGSQNRDNARSYDNL